jgi:hypothetical protein
VLDLDVLAEPPAEALAAIRGSGRGGPRPEGLSAEAEKLTLHLCGERRLAGWYAALGASAPGPALRQLFATLAVEVSRRADASAAALRRLLKSDPAMLPAVLRMALWITRTGDGAAAPGAGAADLPAASERCDAHCIQRMLSMRRTLAG